MQKRALFLSFLIVVALIAFVGCSNDDSGTNSNAVPTELVGEWIYDSVTVNSAEQAMADAFDWDAETVEAHITVNADATQMYEEFDDQDAVVYYDEGILTISGNTISAQVTSEEGTAVTPYTTFSGTWALSGTHLLMTVVQSSDTIRAYLTKL